MPKRVMRGYILVGVQVTYILFFFFPLYLVNTVKLDFHIKARKLGDCRKWSFSEGGLKHNFMLF